MYSEGNSNALASGVMSALPLHIGSPPVFNEKCSRGVFARGGSLNMLWGTFGFYSCIICCAITGKLVHMCFTHAFICRLAVCARNDLGRPPFQLDCFLNMSPVLGFLLFFKNASKLLLRTLPGPMCI